jgi:hypothetical protein
MIRSFHFGVVRFNSFSSTDESLSWIFSVGAIPTFFVLYFSYLSFLPVLLLVQVFLAFPAVLAILAVNMFYVVLIALCSLISCGTFKAHESSCHNNWNSF